MKGESEEVTKEIREWHYYSKSRHKKAVLADQAMFVIYEKYNTFKTLREDFIRIVNVLFDEYDDLQGWGQFMSDETPFSEEYGIAREATQPSSTDAPPKSAEQDIQEQFEQYDTGKPVRVTVRGIIIHD